MPELPLKARLYVQKEKEGSASIPICKLQCSFVVSQQSRQPRSKYPQRSQDVNQGRKQVICRNPPRFRHCALQRKKPRTLPDKYDGFE